MARFRTVGDRTCTCPVESKMANHPLQLKNYSDIANITYSGSQLLVQCSIADPFMITYPAAKFLSVVKAMIQAYLI